MKGWIEVDADGRSFLVRAGTGVVTAVAPIGVAGPDGSHAIHRVDVAVTPPPGRPRSIRVTVHGQVPGDSPLLAVSLASEGGTVPVAWEIEWHRLEWVPDDIAITDLDLARDATAALTALRPIPVHEQAEAFLMEQAGESS